MKIRSLILSLVLMLSIGGTNLIPAYADPGKEADFEEIFKEFSLNTTRFVYDEKEADSVLDNAYKEGQPQPTNDDMYSAYLEKFREGKGDCTVAAYALSKLFTEKGISNRILTLTYSDRVAERHAVVCYRIDGCKEGETGFRIADFFNAKNIEESMIKKLNRQKSKGQKNIIKQQIEKTKRYCFSMPLKDYFNQTWKVGMISAQKPLDSNRKCFFDANVPSIELPEIQGGWPELVEAFKNEGIKFKVDEKCRRKILFDKIRGDLLEKSKRPEYASIKEQEKIVDEVSNKLTEAGIEHKVLKVATGKDFTQKVICYKDNFNDQSNDKEYFRIIDFTLAFCMMKTGEKDCMVIANNLLGAYTKEEYSGMFGANIN